MTPLILERLPGEERFVPSAESYAPAGWTRIGGIAALRVIDGGRRITNADVEAPLETMKETIVCR